MINLPNALTEQSIPQEISIKYQAPVCLEATATLLIVNALYDCVIFFEYLHHKLATINFMNNVIEMNNVIAMLVSDFLCQEIITCFIKCHPFF